MDEDKGKLPLNMVILIFRIKTKHVLQRHKHNDELVPRKTQLM